MLCFFIVFINLLVLAFFVETCRLYFTIPLTFGFYVLYLTTSIVVIRRFYKDELFWNIKSDGLHSNHLMSTFIKSKPKLYTHEFLWELSYCKPKKLQRDIKEEFQYKYWVDVTNSTITPSESAGSCVRLVTSTQYLY